MSPSIRKPSRSNKKQERRTAIERGERTGKDPSPILLATRELRPHMAQEFEEAGLTALLPEITGRLRPWAAVSAVGMTPEDFYRKHGERLA